MDPTSSEPTNIPLSNGSGQIRSYADFPSQYIAARHVDIWIPPDYAAQPDLRYPVLYMHDGQNLFDPALSSLGIDWGMDEALTRLIRSGGRPGAIVVGIWNSTRRWRDYMPAKPLLTPAAGELRANFIHEQGGKPMSDQYLRFLVRELKPFIDSRYRTLPGAAQTFVMGSSMGGLISLYALVEYPQVFGGAACLSTHWPAGGELLVKWLGQALPPAGQHRLYFDYGTETLDAAYEPYQKQMDEFVRAAGYQAGRDWLTRKFEGADHSERAWRARVHIPLEFLLSSKETL